MMKRILAVVLSLLMIVSVASVGVSASYYEKVDTSVGDNQTTVVDGETFTVVTKESTLRTLLAGNTAGLGYNILLGSDIALTSSEQIVIAPGTVLDGNGYSITYNGTLSSALFKFATGVINHADGIGGTSKVVIRNVSFGNSDTPMTLTGSTGLFAEAEASSKNYVVWQNVTFCVNHNGTAGNLGAIFANVYGTQEFSGCTLTVNMPSAGALSGGWVGQVSGGQLYMTDCTVIGVVNAANGAGGFMGQQGGGKSTFINCINHAAVTARNSGNSTAYVGGFVGNVGGSASALTFTGCKNYGAVTSNATGYGGMAGGFIGRMTNANTNAPLHAFYNCVNYGTITSGSSAGGFVGRNHDYDYANPCYYPFYNCLNVGAVSGNQYAGGLIGVASPLVEEVIIKNCANIGKITSNGGYAGNFGGMLNDATISGSYAFGAVVGSVQSGVLCGQCANEYTVQSGSLKDTVINGDLPTSYDSVESSVTDTYYLGTLSNHVHNATLATNQATVFAEMRALYGMNFVEADAADEDAYVVIADPQIRGIQAGTAANSEEGVVNYRVSAVINALEAYSAVGFRGTVMLKDGTKAKFDIEVNKVYNSINASGEDAKLTKITAEALGGKYIYAVTFTNVPANYCYINITPYAISVADGSEYVGKERTIICQNSSYMLEPMYLNGASLATFSVVYPANGSNNEQLLAERLAKQLTSLTGQTVSCYSDATEYKANEIWVGQCADRSAENLSGRWIYRPDMNTADVQLYADNTTALSEVVQEFIDRIAEKRENGVISWNMDDQPISVAPDQTVSIMAYNTGAKNAASIMEAEWELITKYLPDIYTMQEPWAGWLDDFMNNYAVQPSTKFQATNEAGTNAADGDYDKNNTFKNGTGAGYYGIYWGLPRWATSSEQGTSGRASYSVILYAKDRFTVDESKSGTFWLTDTPNKSGSFTTLDDGTIAQHTRCATYATLTDNNTGETFVVVNVHLDFDEALQKKQVGILLQELKNRVGTDHPIFITGDMNAEFSTQAIQFYFDNNIMPMTALDTIAERSYRNSRTIDWLFTNDTEHVIATYYNYCSEKIFFNNQWSSNALTMPSDHPAVYAEVVIDTGATRPTVDVGTTPSVKEAESESIIVIGSPKIWIENGEDETVYESGVDVGFNTINEALAYAQENGSDKIVIGTGNHTISDASVSYNGQFTVLEDASLTVTAGSYYHSVAEYLPNGYMESNATGMYVVEAAPIVKKTGGTITGYYNDFATALNDAVAGDTVLLKTGDYVIDSTLNQTTFEETFEVEAGASLTIFYGSFTTDVSAYLPEGYTTVNDGTFYHVQKCGIWNGNVYYTSLEDALAAATAEQTVEVYSGTYVLDDASLNALCILAISDGVTVTVSAGTYSNQTWVSGMLENHVSQGYTGYANADGTFTVLETVNITVTPDGTEATAPELGEDEDTNYGPVHWL